MTAHAAGCSRNEQEATPGIANPGAPLSAQSRSDTSATVPHGAPFRKPSQLIRFRDRQGLPLAINRHHVVLLEGDPTCPYTTVIWLTSGYQVKVYRPLPLVTDLLNGKRFDEQL